MGKYDLDRKLEEGGGQNELKVTDRRLFDAHGRLREELAGEPDEDEAPAAEPGFEHRPSDEEPAGVDFTMLIHAMAQPALIYLGMTAHPATGKPEVNLEQARLQIDMLDVLQTKSRGNLTDEEEGLLDKLLYELRMQFVARSDEARTAPPS